MLPLVPKGYVLVGDFHCPSCEKANPKNSGINKHFIMYLNNNGSEVVYKVACQKHDCDSMLDENGNPQYTKSGDTILQEKSWRILKMPVKIWNDMIAYARKK